MYKATLPNGWFLAVNRITDSPYCDSQFVYELLAFARMQHDNLILLLGFCIVMKGFWSINIDRLYPIEGDANVEYNTRLKKKCNYFYYGKSNYTKH